MRCDTTSVRVLSAICSALAGLVIAASASAANFTVNATKAGSGAGTVTSAVGAISCGNTCSDSFAEGTSVTLSAVAAPGSQFIGWLGPCIGTGTCQFDVAAATAVSATFAAPALTGRPLDVDANDSADALTDGLMILRALFGLTGASLITGAIGPNATRPDAAQIAQHIRDIGPILDIDGNGAVNALTDGLLVLRHMFGLRGSSLTVNAVGTGARFTDPAEIAARIQAAIDRVTAVADLTIVKSHTGNFRQGDSAGIYTITVSNAGPGATAGTVTVADDLPAGLTATAISGTGWSCTLGTLTCTRSDALAAGASYPAITLTVNVAGNAASSVTNTAVVSGGGELNTANNTASDPTPITSTLPPDPASVAPPNTQSTVTLVSGSTQFLYTGPNPIQTGVAPETITAARASVLRGKVKTSENAALSDVTVTILDHPELGQTRSRADGGIDMAVNGGSLLTLDYRKTGFLPVQRQINVGWQTYGMLPDVVMTALDSAVTTVALNSGAMQVARGGAVTDADGARRATVLFPSGTTADLVLSDGTTQPLMSMNVRATEYTVGPNGVNAMPGPLPPSSGYTYAVELSADEAIAANARSVVFSQPVFSYLENFLAFPVGMAVPAGYYDRAIASWVPSLNGRVIKITAINGGVAVVDTVGTGSLTAIALGTAELQQLAQLYSVGQQLWRVPIAHFTPWDYNWPYGPPADARPPELADPTGDDPLDDPNCSEGSIIECENQVVGQKVPLVGMQFNLHYRSSRVPGRTAARKLTIPISALVVPASVERIEVSIDVAGRNFTTPFGKALNQQTSFDWDGLDGYGRPMQGRQAATIRVGYVYKAVYVGPANFERSFERAGGDIITGNTARTEVTIPKTFFGYVGAFDARGAGLGGWSLGIHHLYDPTARSLYLGNGQQIGATSISNIVTTVAGTGTLGSSGNGGLATVAEVRTPTGIAMAADGGYYIAAFRQVRRVDPNGIITAFAGDGRAGTGGDGGPATSANVSSVNDVAVGPDGSVYIADGTRVRRVGRDGLINTVAGTTTGGFSGDEGPATQAQLVNVTGVAVAADGTLYIADGFNRRIRKVTTDGIIKTFAGVGGGTFSGDGGPATNADLVFPRRVALGPDGSVYIADHLAVRRVTPDGIIRTVAGTGNNAAFNGDDIPALQANLQSVSGVAIEADGGFYFTEAVTPGSRVRYVGVDGIVRTRAGNGSTAGFNGDSRPATQAVLFYPEGITIAQDGSLLIADSGNNRIRKVTRLLPGFTGADYAIPSTDGRQVYRFANSGSHLQTLDSLTGTPIHEFGYDTAGRLTTITGKTGGQDNVTTIQRNVDGTPRAIISPFGQTTTLTHDANGFLSSISNPANETVQITSTTAGLITSFTDARGKTSQYAFDSGGRLTSAADAGGGTQTLSRQGSESTQFQVTHTTGLSRTTLYKVTNAPSRVRTRTITSPDTLDDVTQTGLDAGTVTVTAANGTISTATQGPDPRFGMQSPLTTSLGVASPGGGPSMSMTKTRSAVLGTPGDPFSVQTLTDTTTIAGRTTTSVFDATTMTTQTTSAAGRIANMTVDTRGRPVLRQMGGLNALNIGYDSRGRIATLTQGAGAGSRTITFAYDAAGFLQSITDPLGRVAQMAYDSAGRMTSKTFPDGRVVSFTYDAGGNMTSLVPPGKPAHGFLFSDRNTLVGMAPPAVAGAGPTTYGYNVDKQITLMSRPGGQTTAFEYDTSGRLSKRTQATNGVTNGIDTLTYDAGGRLDTIAAPGGVLNTYSYSGRFVTGMGWSGPVTGGMSRTYDTSFRIASESVNGAETVTFSYDNDSLLLGAGDLAITHNAQNGLATATALGTITTTTGYDGFGAIVSQSATAGGTPFFNLQLTRDALGRISQKIETVSGTTDTYVYTYSTAGRLTGVTKNGAAVEAYAYDTNGNRTSATISGVASVGTYDAQDRLVQYGAGTYVYNGAGDLRSITDGGGTTNYSYDQRGNLLSVALPGAVNVGYVVDGNNRRIGRKFQGTLVKGFVYSDKLRPVAELDGASTVVSRFVYTGRNVPAYLIKGSVRHRIITDTLGSVRLVVNADTGAVVQRMDYDSYGNVTQDTNPGFQPFGFAGGIYDPDTKLVRFGARDYDAKTGRWTAKDPIQFRGGDTNLYAYVGGDPVNLADSKGASPDGGCTLIPYKGSGIGFLECSGSKAPAPAETGQSLVPPAPETPEPDMCSPDKRKQALDKSGPLHSDLDTGQSCGEGFLQASAGEKNQTVCLQAGASTNVTPESDVLFPEAMRWMTEVIGADVPKVTGGGYSGAPRG